MPESSMPVSFQPFVRLPTELRLKIWDHIYDLTPPRLLPFYVCTSDLDFLRFRRTACHNYPHIFARKMETVPPILHICRESRDVGLQYYSLGFDISRIPSLGREDTDVDTYTTCPHEIAMDEKYKGLYWDRSKDVLFLDSTTQLETGSETAAYVWGGKTGVRFGKMKKVAMSFNTLRSCGLGEYLGWEGIATLFVLMPDMCTAEELLKAERFIQMSLKKAGLRSTKNQGVEVEFHSGPVEELLQFGSSQ